MNRSSLVCNHPKTLLVVLLMLVSTPALSDTCKFGGEYVWSEKGKNFVGPPGNEVVVELVEVGRFAATRDGSMSGDSEAVFRFPDGNWVHVSIGYFDGEYEFDGNDCTGSGSWSCDADLISSAPPFPDSTYVEGLVEQLCAMDISYSFVTSENGRKLDFIITTPKLVSSGSATRIRSVAEK